LRPLEPPGTPELSPGYFSVTGGSSALATNFFLATAVLDTALRFFLAAFLAADFTLRVRMAFFCIELRFEGMVIPFVAFPFFGRIESSAVLIVPN